MRDVLSDRGADQQLMHHLSATSPSFMLSMLNRRKTPAHTGVEELEAWELLAAGSARFLKALSLPVCTNPSMCHSSEVGKSGELEMDFKDRETCYLCNARLSNLIVFIHHGF